MNYVSFENKEGIAVTLLRILDLIVFNSRKSQSFDNIIRLKMINLAVLGYMFHTATSKGIKL